MSSLVPSKRVRNGVPTDSLERPRRPPSHTPESQSHPVSQSEPATIQPGLSTSVGRKRSLSANYQNSLRTKLNQHNEFAPFEDTHNPPRLPSPLLVADFSFRQDVLTDHYFEHSFRRQFYNNAIRGTQIPDRRVIEALIDQNPALRHAICALAGLTFPSHPPPSQREILAHVGLALAFLRKIIGSHFLDESTLLAVVEIVDFERGTQDHSGWPLHLDAAISVLKHLSFIHQDLVDGSFSTLQEFFLRNLTFNDIIAATSLCRTPVMYLRHIHNLNVGLGVHKLFGCEDRTLAIISQGAELEQWKSEKRANGELSIGDLYKKGSRILMQLWERGGVVEGVAPIVAEIYRCSAAIYLNVIMSGAYSGIDEVKKAIPYLVNSIELLLPHTEALNLLCWPIVVGGSLAILPQHRQLMKLACQRMDGVGDFSQTLKIIERAWEMRDSNKSAETHWRDIMREFGWCLLFT